MSAALSLEEAAPAQGSLQKDGEGSALLTGFNVKPLLCREALSGWNMY